jgi:hypothetical protein
MICFSHLAGDLTVPPANRVVSLAAWRSGVLLALTLTFVTVVVTRGIRTGEFDYNVDESQHAATGLFVAELIRDHPLADPVHYTYLYYAQYPALSGVIHWPPFFYLCEGVIFFVLGPSVVAARLTILLFTWLGCYFWFRLVKELQNDRTAALSTIVFALLPSVLLFEKAVMLEIPSLALCITALYYWQRFVSAENRWDLYRFALFSSLALLTKQNALYLAVVCALTIVLLRKWKLLLSRRMLAAIAIVAVLTGPYYTVAYLVHWKTIAMDLVGNTRAVTYGEFVSRAAQQLIFYWGALPELLTWPLLVMSLLGIATSRWWSTRQASAFMLIWIAGVYLTFTFISHKEPRYAIYWIPPFTYFAVGPFTADWRVKSMRVAASVCAVLILVVSLQWGWRYKRPYVSGYSAVPEEIARRSASGIILFDGDLPANFIFFMKSLDPERRFLVLRKSLWTMRIKETGGSEELVHSKEEVREVIRRDGIRYIVITEGSNLWFDVQRRLREFLAGDPQFTLLKVFPIESNQPEWKNHRLLLYENTRYQPPTAEFLHIRMMTLTKDIVVRWSELRRTW